MDLINILLSLFYDYWLFIIIFILATLYYQHVDTYSFWSKRGIITPTPILPILGNTYEIFYKDVGKMELEHYQKYGRFYGYYENSQPTLIIAEPEILRKIFTKDFSNFVNRQLMVFRNGLLSKMLSVLADEDWKRVRALITPSFSSHKIKRMFVMMNECVDGLLDKLESSSKVNADIDMHKLFFAYTMDVIAYCGFAIKLNAHNNPNNPFIQSTLGFFDYNLTRVIIQFILPKFVQDLFNFTITPDSVPKFFERTTKELVKARKQSNAKYEDLFQLLLNAENFDSNIINDLKDINSGHFTNQSVEDLEMNAKLLNESIGAKNKNDQKKKYIAEIEFAALIMEIFVAGSDPTASTLIFAIYFLLMNPDVEEKLYKEISDYAKRNNGKLNYDTINEMKYLNAVIDETLRFYPPVAYTERNSAADYTIPEKNNFTVPAGTTVRIPIYAIHHDPQFYEDPEKFNPDRFLPENLHKIKPYTYLPFGAGPRNCIGLRVGLLAAKTALFKILLKYRFIRSENTKTPIEFYNEPFAMVIKPKIILKVIKR